jgi:1,4-dihydroxy-2-naphthoyl-CoA hydrolase
MPFVYSRTVRLADTDAAGVIYFAQIFNLCHEAYEEALASSGIDLKALVRDATVALPIVHSSLDCLRPIFWGDRLLVRLRVSQLRERSFETAYEIVSQSDPETLLAQAIARHVCIHPQTRAKVPLPEAIARSLASLP